MPDKKRHIGFMVSAEEYKLWKVFAAASPAEKLAPFVRYCVREQVKVLEANSKRFLEEHQLGEKS